MRTVVATLTDRERTIQAALPIPVVDALGICRAVRTSFREVRDHMLGLR